jgi:hypothetical protein
MTTSFQIHQFNYRVGKLLCVPLHRSSTSLPEHLLNIARLRRDYKKVDDKVVQGYIDRTIEELRLRALIDASQPFAVVSRQFHHNFNRGFHSPWTEAFSNIEFAEYCLRQKRASRGLLAVEVAKKRLSAINKGYRKGEKKHLLREIEMCMDRLSKATQKKRKGS